MKLENGLRRTPLSLTADLLFTASAHVFPSQTSVLGKISTKSTLKEMSQRLLDLKLVSIYTVIYFMTEPDELTDRIICLKRRSVHQALLHLQTLSVSKKSYSPCCSQAHRVAIMEFLELIKNVFITARHCMDYHLSLINWSLSEFQYECSGLSGSMSGGQTSPKSAVKLH